MRYWNLKKINKSAYDKTGIIPRSIINLFERFKKELSPAADINALEEFKVSRYQTLASIKYLLFLLIMPIIINQVSQSFILDPCINYFWNNSQQNIFLNESQEERAFAELQRFEEKLHFEILIGQVPNSSSTFIHDQIMKKAFEIASKYATESCSAIKNIISDFFSIAVFITIIIVKKKQFFMLKSFVNQLIYGLSDTAKAFLIIMLTDMFVGFHSPHGWEIVIEVILRHFGVPESRDFIFVFISTFPVVLDTIFKYWIFRYLNRVSPSAVATYHSMNE
uniref:Envelope membrane protein n=1 Tax=Dicranema revolutum TaxID=239144 RepID=A0A4D6WUC2_9FLOR|nr:Envelope membrane protein [Dicranema revolutum]